MVVGDQRVPDLSKREIADIIERFILDSTKPWEWDDFVSVPLRDPALDTIRKQCRDLPDCFPPTREGNYSSDEGVKFLENLVKKLREDT